MIKKQSIGERFFPGDVVMYFKRELLPPEELGTPKYLYLIIALAHHTETAKPLVVYQALYGNKQYYARPLDSFLSVVDVEKYPTVNQKFKFEKLSSNYGELR